MKCWMFNCSYDKTLIQINAILWWVFCTKKNICDDIHRSLSAQTFLFAIILSVLFIIPVFDVSFIDRIECCWWFTPHHRIEWSNVLFCRAFYGFDDFAKIHNFSNIRNPPYFVLHCNDGFVIITERFPNRNLFIKSTKNFVKLNVNTWLDWTRSIHENLIESSFPWPVTELFLRVYSIRIDREDLFLSDKYRNWISFF